MVVSDETKSDGSAAGSIQTVTDPFQQCLLFDAGLQGVYWIEEMCSVASARVEVDWSALETGYMHIRLGDVANQPRRAPDIRVVVLVPVDL